MSNATFLKKENTFGKICFLKNVNYSNNQTPTVNAEFLVKATVNG